MRQVYYILGIAVALSIPSFGLAHEDGTAGIPKNYCETGFEPQAHDYGDPALGFVIFLGQDGNLQGECDSDPNTVADYDGHIEFAHGGAWLTAAASPGCNDGDLVDHSPNPTVYAVDDVLTPRGVPVTFSVYADTLNNIPPVDPAEPNCGDFESDFGADCTDSCAIGFPPGLDGTYQVYVNGGHGHVLTLLTECNDKKDNDGDGNVDYFWGMPFAPWGNTDRFCNGFFDNDEDPKDA